MFLKRFQAVSDFSFNLNKILPNFPPKKKKTFVPKINFFQNKIIIRQRDAKPEKRYYGNSLRGFLAP
jgi:hypothetical protein